MDDEKQQVNIRLTAEEIAEVRDITKVDALAPAIVAIIRKEIERVHAQRAQEERQ